MIFLECFFFFGLVPPVFSWFKPHGLMYLLLWVLAGVAWWTLQRHYGYRIQSEWNAAALTRSVFRTMFLRFVPLAVALFVFTLIAIPDKLFSLPRERPQLWVMVMILYPTLSVFAQEVLFRSYFFRRYKTLFPTPLAMNLASALAFGWVHILLQNWVAVLFSAAGGLLFADTYRKTNSLAAVCAEHALYGCWIFTLGLGTFFYHGAAVK